MSVICRPRAVWGVPLCIKRPRKSTNTARRQRRKDPPRSINTHTSTHTSRTQSRVAGAARLPLLLQKLFLRTRLGRRIAEVLRLPSLALLARAALRMTIVVLFGRGLSRAHSNGLAKKFFSNSEGVPFHKIFLGADDSRLRPAAFHFGEAGDGSFCTLGEGLLVPRLAGGDSGFVFT